MRSSSIIFLCRPETADFKGIFLLLGPMRFQTVLSADDEKISYHRLRIFTITAG